MPTTATSASRRKHEAEFLGTAVFCHAEASRKQVRRYQRACLKPQAGTSMDRHPQQRRITPALAPAKLYKVIFVSQQVRRFGEGLVKRVTRRLLTMESLAVCGCVVRPAFDRIRVSLTFETTCPQAGTSYSVDQEVQVGLFTVYPTATES